MNFSIRIIAMVLVVVFAASILPSQAWADDAVVATYNSRCGNCHAANGSGKTPAGVKMSIPDLRSKEVQGLSNAQLYETIAKGTKHKNYPHAFLYTGLNDNQITGLVAHIRKLK
jgi:mono/diheme cytochrome c family protein